MQRLLIGLFLCLAFTAQAATQQNASAGAVKLEGQVVCCADCWAEADRTKVEFGTAEDLLKSQSCVAHGDPTLHDTGLPVAPYVGVAYGTFEDRARIIGGLNINLSERWSSTMLFDGVRVHPTANYTYGRHQFGVSFERGRHPGASYSVSF